MISVADICKLLNNRRLCYEKNRLERYPALDILPREVKRSMVQREV